MNQGAEAATTAVDLLKAPGFGLLTVSTGAAPARAFLKTYFKNVNPDAWPEKVRRLLLDEREHASPLLLGVPSDSGGGICRGAAHGPQALRKLLYARNRAWARHDLGDVPCIPQLVHDSMLNERQLKASGRALWGDKYRLGLPVSPLNLLESVLTEALRAGARPLVLGGDHSIAGPIFAALANVGLARKLAVLHIDAHTDLLESRFGVEHCFGTWTSKAVRLLDDPANWVQIGIRASGREQNHWESTFGLRQFWSASLKRVDPAKFADQLVEEWRRRGCEHLYITHDIDGTDAKYVPSTGTPEAKGLDPVWLRRVLKRVTHQMPLVGSDLVEVAPVVGSKSEAARTLRTALSYLEALEWN